MRSPEQLGPEGQRPRKNHLSMSGDRSVAGRRASKLASTFHDPLFYHNRKRIERSWLKGEWRAEPVSWQLMDKLKIEGASRKGSRECCRVGESLQQVLAAAGTSIRLCCVPPSEC